MEKMEQEINDYKIEVDMSAFVSDKAKDLRSKIRSCQSQLDYLAYKYELYAKKQEQFKSEYLKLLGVENDKSVQQK